MFALKKLFYPDDFSLSYLMCLAEKGAELCEAS
jgi:hypothetical protein